MGLQVASEVTSCSDFLGDQQGVEPLPTSASDRLTGADQVAASGAPHAPTTYSNNPGETLQTGAPLGSQAAGVDTQIVFKCSPCGCKSGDPEPTIPAVPVDGWAENYVPLLTFSEEAVDAKNLQPNTTLYNPLQQSRALLMTS